MNQLYNEQTPDPFILPAETDVRFFLLIGAAVAMAATVGSFFSHALFPGTSDGVGLFPAEANDGISNAGLTGADLFPQLLAAQRPGLLFWFGFIILMFTLTSVLYVIHPYIIRRHKKLELLAVEKDPQFFQAIDQLATVANIAPRPAIVQNKHAYQSTHGQVFGFLGKYTLSIDVGLRLLLRQNPHSFQAIVLHELAHIANGDVWRAQFATATWYAVTVIALLPLLIYLWSIVTGGVLSLMSTAIAGELQWNRLVALISGPPSLITLQVLVTVLIVWTIYCGLLRTRELYADWRAAQLGVRAALEKRLAAEAAKTSQKRRWHPWRYHPTAQERLAVLGSADTLFQFSLELPFWSGLLLGYLWAGFPRILIPLWLPVRTWSEALHAWIILVASSLPEAAFRVVATLSAVAFQHLIPDLVFVALLLLIAYLVVGTVGVQIQRQLVGSRGASEEKRFGAGQYFIVSAILTSGVAAGLLLAPANVFLPNSTTALWVAFFCLNSIVLVTWLWTLYARFLTQEILLRYEPSMPGRKVFRRLTIWQSCVLCIVYLPVLLSLIVVGVTNSVATLGDAAILWIWGIAVGALLLGLAAYGAIFLVTWLGLKLNRPQRLRPWHRQHPGASHFWGIGRARKTDLSAYPRKCGTHPQHPR